MSRIKEVQQLPKHQQSERCSIVYTTGGGIHIRETKTGLNRYFYPALLAEKRLVFSRDENSYFLQGEKMTESRPKLKLLGADGNVFNVLGLAQASARAAGWSKEKIDNFMKEAMAGDYGHVIVTCMKYFTVS